MAVRPGRVRSAAYLPAMTEPVSVTLTMRMHLEVADPEALLAWVAAEAVRATAATRREMTLALVADVPGALQWAYTADPDCDPPGVVLTSGAVGIG